MAVEIVTKPMPIKSIPNQKYQIFMYKRDFFYYGFISKNFNSVFYCFLKTDTECKALTLELYIQAD